MAYTRQIARKHLIADGLELAAQTCLEQARDPDISACAKARYRQLSEDYQQEAERVRAE